MLSKKFVSIYFTSTGVQVLLLSGRKKKMKVAAFVDVPSEVIDKHKVLDVGAMSSVLSGIWKKYKISEKSVGLVIPEFSTLTKTLEISGVEKEELDEAVRWQSREFLPWELELVVLDWKIIQEENNSYTVVLVAVKRVDLTSYVDAASGAGLFPVVVETPSMSLARLSGTNSGDKLVFYVGKSQKLVILSKGQKFIASSVSYSGTEDELVSIARQMLNHYKYVGVKIVELGGQRVTDGLIKRITEEFKLKVEVLGKNIKFFSGKELQRSLIPISLQYKEAEEPADYYSINLLPENWAKRYENTKLKLRVWSMTLMVSFVVWVTFFSVLFAYLFMGQWAGSLEVDNKQFAPVVVATEQTDQLNSANSTARSVIAISDATVLPQTILNSIYQARPEVVTISHYRLDLDGGLVDISGIAGDRDALIVFKQKLEEDSNFSLVEIPIESLEVEKNLDYSMSFRYLPLAAIKKGQVPK